MCTDFSVRLNWHRLFGFLIISMLLVSTVSAATVESSEDLLQKSTKTVSDSRKILDQAELVAISTRLSQALGTKQDRNFWLPQAGLADIIASNPNKRIDLSDVVVWNAAMAGRNVVLHESNGTPIFVSSNITPLRQSVTNSAMTPSETAIAFITSNQELFRLNSPVDELLVKQELDDEFGKRHIVFQQQYRGISVWGHELVAHLESNGDLYLINGRYSPTPDKLDLKADRIYAEQAVEIAMDTLSTRTSISALSENLQRILEYDGPKATLYVWIDDDTQEPHLAWQVQIRPNLRDNWYIFVDAVSGQLLELYNNTKSDGPATALAMDLNGSIRNINVYQVGSPYYMIDATRSMWQVTQPDILNDPKGALRTTEYINDSDTFDNVSSNDNSWNDPTSVSAHYNAERAYEYYYSTFGRNAIDDSGSTIISIIHVPDSNGQQLDNAFWNAPIIYYGDGNVAFKPLAGALDVAAHEMTHGVIDYTVNLEYKFQSGALNESFADVFGCMVDRDDWLLGEDVVELAYFPSGAMRNMQDPHNGGTDENFYWQPSHMNEYVVLPSDDDDGGVHTNSGIVNRAAYLIGSTIGKDKLEQIYYRILQFRYLVSQSQFIDMRLAAIQSATDLYGYPSTEVDVVRSAFDAVGINDGPGSVQPADVDPVVGEEWVAVVNAEPADNSLYLIKPDIPSSAINQLTTTQVFTGTGCPISVDRKGTGIVFIDSANFMRAINMDGSGETIISAAGEWFSVALSPDGRKLAATSIYADSTIYIFDLLYPDSNKTIHLYCPTTAEGIKSYITLYADALDWNLSGEYLLYDAFNSIPQAGGGEISYWDINIVEVANSNILNLFAPLPDGIMVGNPAFASTNDIFLVFDLMDVNANTNSIRGINLFAGTVSIIADNGTSVGFPEFSADDSRIVFQSMVGGDKTLWQIPVDSTKIVPTGPAQSWISQGSLPTWFTIAAVVGVDEPDEPEESQLQPETYSLSQNYPNPFNPKTKISFDLAKGTIVKLEIFNITGQKVATLAEGRFRAGKHTVEWEANYFASGMYLYRLTVGEIVLSKKMLLLK